MANGKVAYYFSHDVNARMDEKILMLRAEHGWEGYGIYWALIEMMFDNSKTCLCHKKITALALGNNIDIALLSSVIETCIQEGLFKSDGESFWSDSLKERKEAFLDRRQKYSEAGKKGMESRWNKDNDNDVITTLKQPYNSKGKVKVNELKENEIKEKEKKEEKKREYAENVKLTDAEYEKLTNEWGRQGTTRLIAILDNYKGSTGKKYKSDYKTILNWVTERYLKEGGTRLKKPEQQTHEPEMSEAERMELEEVNKKIREAGLIND